MPLPGALEIRFPSLDNIELHVPCVEAGEVRYRVQRAGDQASQHAREVKHRNHVFRIPMAGMADALVTADRDAQLGYGLFYGLVIALFL